MVNAELLNETQRGALASALPHAADAAASTLSGLLTKNVTLTPAGLVDQSLSEVASAFGGGMAVVRISLSGGASGAAAVIMAEGNAALMADLMIGQDGSSAPATLSDLHLSAIGEVASQMVSALTGGLSSSLGKKFSANSSDIEVSGNLDGLTKALGGQVVNAEMELTLEGHPSSRISLILSSAAANSLTGAAPVAAAPASQGGGFSAAQNFGGGASAGPATVQPAQMSNISQGGQIIGSANLELLMDVPLQITVELGRTHKTVRDILAFGSGSVVELEKLAGEPVDILINERPIAKGEVVVIDENFGIRITEILAPKERIQLWLERDFGRFCAWSPFLF
jgi:flagellar motor switch protein FliN/FliY